MYLLIITTLLSVVSVSNTHISRTLISWLKRPSKNEQELRQEILNLRKDQARISISDNFAAHAKMQRKINSLENKLQNEASDHYANLYIMQFVVVYGIKIAFAIFFLAFAVYYRRTPVYIFPDYMDLSPFNRIISYPNEQLGSVSVHFWLLVTNSVARQLFK